MKNVSNIFFSVLGASILAFGLYNIHSVSDITEGGVLGLTLILKEWFNFSPAFTGAIINFICYGIGIKLLGKKFLAYSVISTLTFSLIYKLLELNPPLWQNIASYPFVASLTGAAFVGTGVGLCVRAGGAPTGDDALALSLSHKFKIKIETVYIVSDVFVLLLSLCYIPVIKIWYSLITVILSGRIVGFVQRFSKPKIITR